MGDRKSTHFTSQGTPAKIAFYGDDLVLPPHESGWSHAIASPGRDRILLVPKDALGDVSLFSVMDGKIVAGSRQDVPAVNYDDPRRWFVSWQHFLSDSWLVGCMNEEDASGHIVVRTSLYAYDVVERSLHRIEIPDPFPEVFQQGIYIQGVSQSSILISTEDGEYTILIE